MPSEIPTSFATEETTLSISEDPNVNLSNNLTEGTDCNADATGMIGSISSSDNLYSIEYTYEIETLSSVSVINTIAPIENAISDILLSLFFPACNKGRLLQEDIF
eukprot:13998936-Ditylum_brightwellii.AAC.1